MEDWRYMNSQGDIDEFLKETMGMHDSVMVGLDYISGTWCNDRMTYFSGPDSKNLRVIFDSPWIDGKISKEIPSGREDILLVEVVKNLRACSAG